MHTKTATLTINIPYAESLKDKRQVRTSLISKVKAKFNVAIAETATTESHKTLTISLAAVSNDFNHANEIIDNTVRYIMSTGENSGLFSDAVVEFPNVGTMSHRFYSNKDCMYFPCHADIEDFNCMFCYCPLYAFGDDCGGQYSWAIHEDIKIKLCNNCPLPHTREYYDVIIGMMTEENLTRLFDKKVLRGQRTS